MADQQRWFKFWCTAPYDDHLQRLSIADRWAWAVLGAYTKAHGTRGHVSLSGSNAALAGAMGIPVTDLVTTVSRLPHIEMVENGHGDFSVTWHNWTKYQEDTTQAERKRASRAKKRGEENKKRVEKKLPPTVPPSPTLMIPPSIVKALDQTSKLGAVPALRTLEYWKANIRATSGQVEYAQEILKAEAWLTANPTRAPRKDLARFLHNWLGRAEGRA